MIALFLFVCNASVCCWSAICFSPFSSVSASPSFRRALRGDPRSAASPWAPEPQPSATRPFRSAARALLDPVASVVRTLAHAVPTRRRRSPHAPPVRSAGWHPPSRHHSNMSAPAAAAAAANTAAASSAAASAAASASPSPSPIPLVVGGRYRLGRRLGCGSFGAIYLATHGGTAEEFAVKLEPRQSRQPQLAHEYRLYRTLQNKKGTVAGVPAVKWCAAQLMRAAHSP